MTIPGLSLRFTPQRIDVAKSGDMAIDFGKVHFGHDDEKTGRPVTNARGLVRASQVNARRVRTVQAGRYRTLDRA